MRGASLQGGLQLVGRYNPGCSCDVNAKQATNIPIKTPKAKIAAAGASRRRAAVCGFNAIKGGGVSSMISGKDLICGLDFCYNAGIQVCFGPGPGKGQQSESVKRPGGEMC